jgi:hypothetical protein
LWPLWALGALLVGAVAGAQLHALVTVDEVRSQAAREAVASIDGDLLAMVRGGLSDESLGRSLDQLYTELGRAGDSLRAASPGDSRTLAQIGVTLEAVRRAREERRVANAMLSRLERAASTSPERMDSLAADLRLQREMLAQAYAVLADDHAGGGDIRGAVALLNTAAKLDPAGGGKYRAAIERLRRGKR